MSKCKVVDKSITSSRRIKLGTVDRYNTKSFYLTISTWVTPKTDNISTKLSRILRLKFNSILENNKISDNTLFDLDIRESGLRKDKKSFMSCEMTFLNNKLIFNDELMNELVDELLSELDNSIISDNDEFTFSAKK